jgi:hypothetical protein
MLKWLLGNSLDQIRTSQMTESGALNQPKKR